MPVWIPIMIAVFATSIMNFGVAFQKKGAVELPRIGEDKAGETLRAFFTNWVWLLGTGLLVGGWGLYLVATDLADISIIQPTLGVGLAVLAAISVFYLRERIKVIEWIAFVAMFVGMIFLGVSAEDKSEKPVPAKENASAGEMVSAVKAGKATGNAKLSSDIDAQPEAGPSLAILDVPRVNVPRMVIISAVILVLGVLAYILGKRGALAGFRTDFLMGVVSGLFVGLAALLTKSMFNFEEAGQDVAAFAVCLPLLIGFNIVGIIVMQSGFQHGKALVVVSLEAVLNKVVAIVGGMAALAETLPEDPLKTVLRICAFVLILFGSAFLARFGGKELAEKLVEAEEEPG